MTRPMTKLQVITNSELVTWRACPLRHRFAYTEKLRPVVASVPLRAGDLLHKGIEAGWLAAWERSDSSPGARLARAIPAALVELGRATQQFESDVQGLPEAERYIDEARDALETMKWAVPHYFECAKADLEFVPVGIEHQFSVKVPNAAGRPGILVHEGKIDLVLWDRDTNRLIVEDHKGTGYAIEAMEKRLALDTQPTGYVNAVKMLQRAIQSGRGLGRVLADIRTTQAVRQIIADNRAEFCRATTGAVTLNVVRRKKPETPKLNLLKKGQITTTLHHELMTEQATTGEPRGEVSVRQIDTTADIYADALQAQFLERELPITDKQRELLAGLKNRRASFFAKLEFFRAASEIERWRRELWIEARRMREAERRPDRATRNPLACSGPASPRCEYEAVCIADEDDPLARSGFRVATSRHEELNDGNEKESNEEEGNQAIDAQDGHPIEEASDPVRF